MYDHDSKLSCIEERVHNVNHEKNLKYEATDKDCLNLVFENSDSLPRVTNMY